MAPKTQLQVLQHFSNPTSGLSTCTSGRAGYANLGITACPQHHDKSFWEDMLEWSSWYSFSIFDIWNRATTGAGSSSCACWLTFAHCRFIYPLLILNSGIEVRMFTSGIRWFLAQKTVAWKWMISKKVGRPPLIWWAIGLANDIPCYAHIIYMAHSGSAFAKTSAIPSTQLY